MRNGMVGEITDEEFSELIKKGAVIKGDNINDLQEKLKAYHPNGDYVIVE